jgi:hypothetical protein
MLRMRALYEAYDMRPTRMCLPDDVTSLSLEEGSRRSSFPSSLTSLQFALPSSVQLLSLTLSSRRRIVSGAIPPHLKWLGVRGHSGREADKDEIPAAVRVLDL